MTKEEKYANFLDKVSEILGLNKPVDILRLCAVTDEYLRPIEKHITELEKEISELKEQNIKDCESFNKTMKEIKEQWNKEHYQLIKAKEIIAKLYHADECFTYDEEAERFLKEI